MRLMVGVLSVLVLVLVGCANEPPSVISYDAVPKDGDPVRGETLYHQQVSPIPTCASCHDEEGNASPTLEGYGEVAGTRVEGQDAHEYTFYAIVEPWRHILDGYGNAMYNEYDDRLSEQDIADLIAYTLGL